MTNPSPPIDLRSDTLSQPTDAMRRAMHAAEVGDAGREDAAGRGEDPTLNRLEDLAAALMGKEAGMYVPSGTMGNLVALMTHCTPGQRVALEDKLHVYHNERAAFMDRPGGLIPEFYTTGPYVAPDLDSIEALLNGKDIRLLCTENTHNWAGGTCLDLEQLNALCHLAQKYNVPVHLDGARVNNAAAYLALPVPALVAQVDSVMFCLSKGLCAPVGSMLCGPRDFIFEARKIRKFMGGTLRQAGVIAAAGIVAIEEQRERLAEDHAHARLLAERLGNSEKIRIDRNAVQTNIVKVDVAPSGLDAKSFRNGLAEAGVKTLAISETDIRLLTYRDISREDVLRAADRILAYCETL